MEPDNRLERVPGMSFNAPVTFNAPMFDIHDNTHVYINAGEERKQKQEPSCCRSEIERIPELSTPEARRLLDRLAAEGLLDADYQPVGLSIAERGVLASLVATRLEVVNLWQVFSSLWGMKAETLRSGNSKAQEQTKTARFMDRIQQILRA